MNHNFNVDAEGVRFYVGGGKSFGSFALAAGFAAAQSIGLGEKFASILVVVDSEYLAARWGGEGGREAYRASSWTADGGRVIETVRIKAMCEPVKA